MGTGAFKYCYHQTGSYFFRTCEDEAVWYLIPRRISPCSETFLGHIGTGILCEVNLGLD